MKRILFSLLLINSSSAQPPADRTVSTTVTESLALTLDQAVFNITLGAPGLVATSRVLTALAEFNVKEEDIISIRSANGGVFDTLGTIFRPGRLDPQVLWTIDLRTAATAFRDTENRLETISRRLPAPFTTLTYSGSLTSSQRSREQALGAANARAAARLRKNADILGGLAETNTSRIVSIAEQSSINVIPSALVRSVAPPTLTLNARYGESPQRVVVVNCTAESSVAPGEAVFRLGVGAAAETDWNSIFAVVTKLNLSERDLADVEWSTVERPAFPFFEAAPPQITYWFEVRMAMARALEFEAKAKEFRESPPAPAQSLTYTVTLEPSADASDQAYSRNASAALSLCRARAETMATAVKGKLGAVISVTPIETGTAAFLLSPAPFNRLFPSAPANLRPSVSARVVYGLE